MRGRIFSLLFCCAVLAATSLMSFAQAQTFDGARPYDPLTASADDYWYHEAQRRRDIDRQLGLVEQMKWYASLPPYFDQTIYYRGAGYDYAAPYYRSAPSLEYSYAAGRSGLFGRYRERVWFGGSIFEPWPLVPGDIWGFPFVSSIPQPIGQRQIQTGPNRWESHPIYARPVDAPPPAPPAAAGPAERGGGGPREF